MKQIVTTFRAEGKQAQRLLRLCRRTPKARLNDLRDSWRQAARETAKLPGYLEYSDGWLTRHDFRQLIGPTAQRRAMPGGEIYFLSITPIARTYLRRQERRKHQFAEQSQLAHFLGAMSTGSDLCQGPCSLAIFRVVVVGSVTDEELRDGSNQPLCLVRQPAAGG